ncbi:hypothetical protein PENSPDRAFT_656397 [Peniophora sp. CONT]|nr:hypothetical protein PENSPDRAFT_656397 [Peniophora sp. CONT]
MKCCLVDKTAVYHRLWLGAIWSESCLEAAASGFLALLTTATASCEPHPSSSSIASMLTSRSASIKPNELSPYMRLQHAHVSAFSYL